jgi:pyridoxine 4-dehydrogenase
MELVKEIEQMAKRKGCTPTQIAITWVSKQSDGDGAPVVPIPGASAISRANENLKVVELSREELREIDEVLAKIEIKGGRYPEAFQEYLEV